MDFAEDVRKKPEGGGQETAHVSGADRTKGGQKPNGGTGQFDRTLDEFALSALRFSSCKRKSAPRLAPVRPKSRHTPEKIAVSCPPPSGFFRRGYWKVHFPSQADWTGGRLGDG
ncbi:hypothetical protein CE91St54_12860 [Hungatella hathewayi]|uniref:Uncharacterized protein n=2 Tax=Hungatella hathewayi TaxID=154046 RepID=A0AA37JJ13_9FIRM|nr:hypothetical protein CE91St55_13360 [Hungatella hathewayi]GKH06178.1 hypothetical protein CE91St54_12860 [Hungatella hathewayi]